MRGPVPKVPEVSPLPSREESFAAWERNKIELQKLAGEISHPGNWPRERWIEHWLKIQAHPASTFAARCAMEALHNLGYRDA